MKRIVLQPAYVLHRRSYRETSVLVEIFSLEYGRLSLVASGVRKEKSSTQGLLQPFIPLLISCSGKGELLRLTHIETSGLVRRLSAECLFAGFYLNELLMHLLEKWDAHPGLYAVYEEALAGLQSGRLEQKTLRVFEKCLLEELGYGLLPNTAVGLEKAFKSENYYRFIPEQGFFVCEANQEARGNVFSGRNLLAIAKEDWQDEAVLQDAKRLVRIVLTPLLGAKSIHSRKLFQSIP